MSYAPAHSPIAVPIGADTPAGRPWLLEVRASKPGLVFWMIVVGGLGVPLITALAAATLCVFYYCVIVSPLPAIAPRIAFAMIAALIAPAALAAPVVFIRMVLGMRRCLCNGCPAVRADAEGLEMYNLYKGWERLPWEEVGTIALPHPHMLVIEHRDPKGWLARQTLWRRWVVRCSRKHTQIDAALGFGMPMEEDGDLVMRKIGALRDAKQMGLEVLAADAAVMDTLQRTR